MLVTRGTPAALAAKNAAGSIPVVMAAIGEPLGLGIVANLARPGGNVTGLSAPAQAPADDIAAWFLLFAAYQMHVNYQLNELLN